jgi:hypothetical protein
MSSRLCFTVMLAAAGLFASVAVLRRPSTEAGPPRGTPPSKPVVEALPPPAPVRPAASYTTPPQAAFWEDLGTHRETRSKTDPEAYRLKMMSSTAEYLGLDAGAFQSVALLSLGAIRDAWRVRDAEVLSLSEFLEREERERREQEIQDRYEAAKREASDRLVSMLGTTARHEEFRNRLGEWIDAVR